MVHAQISLESNSVNSAAYFLAHTPLPLDSTGDTGTGPFGTSTAIVTLTAVFTTIYTDIT